MSRGAIILDLETAPHDRAAEFATELRPPANYSKPEAIDKWRMDTIDKCGLDPDLGRIVALGWMLEGRDLEPNVIVCRDEPSEGVALHELWRDVLLPNGAHRRIVTFNGLGFDLPYLMRRSLYLRVAAPSLNLDRYRTPHLDLYQKLSYNGALKAHSLAFYAKRFDLPVAEPRIDGSMIPALVRDGHWENIRDHCASDVQLTFALAARLGYIESGDGEPRQGALEEAVGF